MLKSTVVAIVFFWFAQFALFTGLYIYIYIYMCVCV